MSKTIKNWQPLDNRLLQKTRVFDLFVKRVRAPEKKYEDDFFYIDSKDWVNLIPLTSDNEIVMVRQYRHGIEEITLELPGGMVHDRNEPPLEAGLRELQEETGYIASKTIDLGWIHPNPALLNNRMYYFLALDVRQEHAQNLDPAEDIAIELHPLDKIPEMLRDGKITHSLTVAGLLQFLLFQGQNFDKATLFLGR